MIQPSEICIRGEWRQVDGRAEPSPDCARIESLIENELQERARSPDGWSTLYIDPSDGRLWEHVYLESHLHGGGPPTLRTLEPPEAHQSYGHPALRPTDIPPNVRRELGAAHAVLCTAGYFPTSLQVSPSFGDFSVTYANELNSVQLARDRGQFIVSGLKREKLEAAGLWRAFHGSRELATQLENWLSGK